MNPGRQRGSVWASEERLVSTPEQVSLTGSDDESAPLHRTTSLAGLDTSCGSAVCVNHTAADQNERSDGHVDSPLKRITVEKARSRGYLVNSSGSALLLGSEELDLCLPQRNITVLVITWNMNGKSAPATLDDLVLPESTRLVADLVAIGTQESPAEQRALRVGLQATLGPSHLPLHSATLGTLQLCVFIRRELIWHCSVIEEDSFSIRQPTNIRTKGCVAVGFQFFGSSFLFLTCHLTAHLDNENRRIVDARRICTALGLPRLLPSRAKSGDVTDRYDNVFWFGDLNFRLTQSRPQVLDHLPDPNVARQPMPADRVAKLLEHDQLNRAKRKGRAFYGFNEGEIRFPPTYKYDSGTNVYDTSSKQRIPAYTDRILYKSRRSHVSCLQYSAVQEYTTSDHKPVWGLYLCKVRPGLANVPLLAGQFDRSVYLEGLQKRMSHLPTHRRTNTRLDCCIQ